MAGSALQEVGSNMTQISSLIKQTMAAATGAVTALGSLPWGYVTGVYQSPIGTIDIKTPELPPMPEAPGFTLLPGPYSQNNPSPPTDPDDSPPKIPHIGSIGIPTDPTENPASFSPPLKPTRRSVVFPSLPVIDWGSFTATKPDPIVITPIHHSFLLDDISSEDELVPIIRNRLKNNILYGGTGLTAAVEEAIWKRDLERNELQLQDSIDKATQAWAKKGFVLPDGMLADTLSVLQKEYMDKLLDRSREISIKQAELEQTNIFKSMEIGINLIATLFEQLYKYEELYLRCQEDYAKFSNEYIELQIKAHNDMVETYKAEVQIYEILLKAQMAKVELYKAQIEGAIAVITLNEAETKMYMAEIEAEVKRYTGILEGNKIRADVFSAKCQGAMAKAKIEEIKIQAYAEQVKGYIAKYEAYAARVKGYEANMLAEKAKMEANAEHCRGQANLVNALSAYYNAGVSAWKASGDHAIALASMVKDASASQIHAAIEQNKSYVAASEVVSRSMQGATAGLIQRGVAIANATSSMAAGAMAALHTAASISYGETMSLKEA